MEDRPHTPDEPTTADEFHSALRRIVCAAQDNGVDVRGGWNIDRLESESGSSVDVEITEVVRPE